MALLFTAAASSSNSTDRSTTLSNERDSLFAANNSLLHGNATPTVSCQNMSMFTFSEIPTKSFRGELFWNPFDRNCSNHNTSAASVLECEAILEGLDPRPTLTNGDACETDTAQSTTVFAYNVMLSGSDHVSYVRVTVPFSVVRVSPMKQSSQRRVIGGSRYPTAAVITVHSSSSKRKTVVRAALRRWKSLWGWDSSFRHEIRDAGVYRIGRRYYLVHFRFSEKFLRELSF